MQAEQMQKQEGENVNVTAIHGNFDDAQQFLKRLFVDKVTAEEVAAKGVMFSSANSINNRPLSTSSSVLCKSMLSS